MSFIGNHLLLCVLCVQIAFALAIAAVLHPGSLARPDSAAAATVLGYAAASLVLIAACTAVLGARAHRKQHDEGIIISGLLETIGVGQEWLWAVDNKGLFTFSSPASASLIGYDPAELVGRTISILIDPEDLANARQNVSDGLNDQTTDWAGIIIPVRHRNGHSVWTEVSGKSRRDTNGTRLGSEGVSRLLPGQNVRTLLKEQIRERIGSTVRDRMILTAFQPIHDLASGYTVNSTVPVLHARASLRSPETTRCLNAPVSGLA